MKIKRGISLRYKFFLLLTGLPLLALVSYLVIAIRVFEDDKIAYVFDSTSSASRTVSAQVRAELTAVINLARPIVTEFDFEKNEMTERSKKLFHDEKLFSFMVFYRISDKTGDFVERASIRKKKDHYPKATRRALARIRSGNRIFTSQLTRLKTEEFWVFDSISVDDRMIVGMRVGEVGSERSIVVLAAVNTQNILPVFQSPGAQKLYLADQSGRIVLGPNRKLKQLSEIVEPNFVAKLKAMKIPEGTEQVKSVNNNNVLVSYSPVGLGGLVTTAMVSKGAALEAVEVLINKSYMFFIALFSTTVIVSIFASGSLTSTLSSLYAGTRKIAEGKFDIKLNILSSDEIGSLASSFNQMAAEVKRLMTETAEKARMEGELQTAQTVQETLFPEKYMEIGNLKIAGNYQPASECGGDWWHYCLVGNRVVTWIGDATGHGAPAALLTSAAKSAASIIEKLDIDTAKALEYLNSSIFDVAKGKLMMTFFVGSYDLDTNEFVYSCASHDPPLLICKKDKPPKKKDLIPLNEVNNARLGQNSDTKYQKTSIKIEPGDSILFYTDGIPEIYNEDGEMWGERNFLKVVLAANKDFAPPDVVIERMMEKIMEFKGDADLRDDLTFFQLQLDDGKYVKNQSQKPVAKPIPVEKTDSPLAEKTEGSSISFEIEESDSDDSPV